MIMGCRWAIMDLATAVLCTFFSLVPARAQTPVLEVRLEQDKARVGEAYRVLYEMSWTGAADAFTVLSTEPEPVSWA